ncbi:MAG: DJ-1/PfpI family protein [Sumerlaeia bacterium]
MATALVPLIDGFEETEAIATVDILRRGGVTVTTAGIADLRVGGSRGIVVQADTRYADTLLARYDAIVLPGGPGARKLNQVEGLHARLRQQAREGVVAAICAAPVVLAAAGLLEGQPAACHPSAEGEMGGARLLRQPVVRAGNILTSRGVGTALDFALALVARLRGEEAARSVAEAIVYDGPGWKSAVPA